MVTNEKELKEKVRKNRKKIIEKSKEGKKTNDKQIKL